MNWLAPANTIRDIPADSPSIRPLFFASSPKVIATGMNPITMGIAVFTQIGLTGVLIYLLAYIFTNLGAFTVVIFISPGIVNSPTPRFLMLRSISDSSPSRTPATC